MKDVMRSPLAKAAVRFALDEDLGKPWCDATSEALVDPKAVATGEYFEQKLVHILLLYFWQIP